MTSPAHGSCSSRLGWSLLLLCSTVAACGPDHRLAPTAPLSGASRSEIDEAPRYSEWSTPVNLGSVLNTIFPDTDPFESKDGLTLYFVSGAGRQPNFGGRDIWVSHRATIDSPWGPPQNLGPTINSAGHDQKPTLSIDGHRLYFASNRAGGLGGFDLYMSRRRDKGDDLGWEAPVNLGSPINSSSNEQGALTLFEDDKTGNVIVYFTSDRPGGMGGFDIYSTTLLPDGSFTTPSLVTELSSSADDQDPMIRRDGLEMFLASSRPGTYGALDLWVSTRATTSDPWSTPVNLGPDINTPTRQPGLEQANDLRPALSFDGTRLYWNSAFRNGNASFMFDIWMSTREKLRGANQ
jgi:hypothetical protein